MESGPLIRFSDVLTKRNGDVLFYFNTYIVQRLLKHDQLTGHLGFRWKPGAFLQIGVAATASGGGCTSFFFPLSCCKHFEASMDSNTRFHYHFKTKRSNISKKAY